MPDAPATVLLVEDDEDDYVLTKELFAELPSGMYHLDRVGDYASALHALDNCVHDIYLVDYRLGAHTGLELMAEAAKRGCHAPMIMLTGQRERELDLQAMKAGAVDYLLKDQLDAATLERSMRYAIRHKRQEETIRQANQQLEQRVLERTEELNESQRFLRSVLDALPSQIAVLDEQGVILAVNTAWRKFDETNEFFSRKYAIGSNYLDSWRDGAGSCTPDVNVAERVRDVLQGRAANFQTEYPCHSPREQTWFQMRVSPFHQPGPSLAVVAHDDITPRVLSEQALRRQSRQLQELSRIATQLNLAHDVRSVLGIITEAARSIIGAHQSISGQVVEGETRQSVWVVSLSDKYDAWCNQDRQALGTSLDAAVCSKNRPLRLTQAELQTHAAYREEEFGTPQRPPLRGWLAAPLMGNNGRNLGLVQLSDKYDGEDFTEEDAAILVQLAQMASVALENAFLYRNLHEADLRKDRFLATLAHELRNPLSPLMAASQLMGMEPENGPQVRELTLIVSRQLEQLRRLIDDLLDVSRISSGKLTLRLELVSLGEAVAAALDVVRPLCRAASQTLNVSLPGGPLIVHGDKVRLSQIVGNLLINASKYTPPHGRIDLEVKVEPGAATVRVRDTGIGLHPEMLTRIFGLFTQVDSSNTRSQGGLGVGLALARTLVELHGGTIQAASAGLGQGCEFSVRLPLAERATMGGQPVAAGPEALLPRYRVLVVDDNQSASHLLGRLLDKLGQKVAIAQSVAAALEKIAEFHPDVIISDIAMPGESGYSLAHRVQELNLDPPPTLIALTGYGQPSDQRDALHAGFSRHLTKPIGLPELEDVLRSVRK